MPVALYRRRLIVASIGMGTSLGLGLAGTARACEFSTDRLRVTHPWTRATLPGATSTVLGLRLDEVSAPDRLIGARTPVAEGAVLVRHGVVGPLDLALAVGDEIDLQEGPLQLRLTGLRHPLASGRDYPLALDFEHSGVVHARLSVDFEPPPPDARPAFARRISPLTTPHEEPRR